ncbi:hypothetical protein KY304_02725, partial [Candidatus Woesearchaeota archaeon]|nr:hypothetical protein [Candidatus Woesearchaeota archaeon]
MFEQEIIDILKNHVKADVTLEIPANKEFGDFAFPCFNLAKELKQNP